MASRSTSDLHPVARELCLKWVDACRKAGYEVLVYCTYRSPEEQNDLYRIGRTVKGEGVSAKLPMGKTVTNAKGGQSFHQYRCAWDFVPLLGGKPQWKNDAMYKRCAEIGEGMGIEWAGRWKSFKETAHMQVTQGHDLAYFQSGGTLC